MLVQTIYIFTTLMPTISLDFWKKYPPLQIIR